MALQPGGVGVVVVVPDLQQHRGEPGLAHLPQGGGGPGGDLIWQGVDLPQLLGDQLRRPLAVDAAGIVEGDDAPLLAVAALRGGVGVEGQVQVELPLVGLPDGAAGGHLRPVALVLDAVGQQVGHQGVRQQIHVVLLGPAAGDVHIPVLGGRAEINSGHGMIPPFFPVYGVSGKNVIN